MNGDRRPVGGGEPPGFAPELPDGDGRRVAVVGAGAVGATAAGDLASAGADVALFDRGDPLAAGGPTAGSSGRAAGVVYDAFAGALDARIADRALARFRALAASGGAGDGRHGSADADGSGFGLTSCPYVLLAREGDDRRVAAVAEAVDGMRRNGREVARVSPDELGDRFPALRVDDVGAAAVADDAGWTDPGSYVRTVAERAAAEGADLRTGTAVELLLDGDEPAVVAADGDGFGCGCGGEPEAFDAVLVAAGAHTKSLLAAAGVPVALKPYRVQALTSRAAYDGPMVYDATGGFYLRPHPTGLLAGDGTERVEADPDAWDRTADDAFVADLRVGLRDRVGRDHDLDLDLARAWAGLCVATPDRDPLLGRVANGVHVAAGWQGHGFMRAPATAELAARSVLGGNAPEPFDPGRFDGSETFEVVEGMTLEEE
jgi:glycine/D-amino acid oxidase-like deaminating enzyme